MARQLNKKWQRDPEEASIIPYPRTKDPLYFDGVGAEIGVEKQRESWSAACTDEQIALRFCNFDHREAEDATRKFVDGGFIDKIGTSMEDTVSAIHTN